MHSPVITGIIVLITYAGIAVGVIPGLRMNRATIALAGAAGLIAVGAISESDAYKALDLGTLTLLFSMMVINVNLRMSGFFRLVADRVLRLAHSPRMLLALVVCASGVLSALFLNDTICLLFTPLVVDLAQRLRRNPLPYLLGLATAVNVGSTATITGNPQNLIIGQASGIPYLTFLLHLSPVAIVGMVICWTVLILLYREEFSTPLAPVDMPPPRIHAPLLNRCLAVLALLLVAFLLGLPIAMSAFIAAGLLMISRVRAVKLLAVDWELLAFFCGLFIVTGAIEVSGLSTQIFAVTAPFLRSGVAQLSLVSAGLSNVVSNVPAVLLLRPEMSQFANPQQAWLTLAMSSTLAGNLTLLGSVANLIVAGIAARKGVTINFLEYLRAGLPITLLTIAFGIIWLSITH